MQTWSVGALPLHREPMVPCVAILCVDLSKHDKFVQVKNKAHNLSQYAFWPFSVPTREGQESSRTQTAPQKNPPFFFV